MAQRLVRIFVHSDQAETIRGIVDESAASWRREWGTVADEACFEVLIPAGSVESLLDPIQEVCSGMKRFRAVVLGVESVVPFESPVQGVRDPAGRVGLGGLRGSRVSRDELYQALDRGARLDVSYVAMVVLSTIVAAIGLLRDQPAVVIGAMVIAPLLGPNMALGLAATLADGALALRALRANAAGVSIAFSLSVAIGLGVSADALQAEEIQSRVQPVGVDLVLALASGIAGAMAFTASAAASLVGVMVAVALLPPLVVVGLHVAMGAWSGAGHASLLLLGNVLCVILAAVGTFLVMGVRPRSWWEVLRARRATLIVIALLVLGFVALGIVLWALAAG